MGIQLTIPPVTLVRELIQTSKHLFKIKKNFLLLELCQNRKQPSNSGTGYQPCCSSGFSPKGQPALHLQWTTSVRTPQPPHLVTGLVPEFNLSVPPAGDDLGGLVRMPQGADAHLVVSLDPVVKLGGLPVPYVQLSICISRHHITGRKRKYWQINKR